jgi:type VI secretion system Hcp family effector
MKSAISTKSAAIGAGLLLIAAVGATVAFNSTAASGAVVPKAVRPAAAVGKPSLYIKFDVIPGSSTAKAHKGASDATAFSGALTSPVDGRTQFGDITVTKPIDIATPKILTAEAKGQAQKQVDLYVDETSASGKTSTVTHIILSTVFITSDQFISTTSGEVEKLTLNYQKIQYDRFNGSTPVSFKWDVAANKGF